MTRLLLLLVQRILKNLNKIGGKVLHRGKRAFYAVHQGVQTGGGRLEKEEEESEEIIHKFEIKLVEGDRSTAVGRGERGQFTLDVRIGGIDNGGIPVS